VPIEVVPFAYAKVLQDLHHILGSPKAALRIAVMKGKLILMSLVSRLTFILTLAGPVVTDNGNFVIDAPFDHERMLDPYVVSKNFSPALLQDSKWVSR
jgi:ribose 5-phosphate isomerase A